MGRRGRRRWRRQDSACVVVACLVAWSLAGIYSDHLFQTRPRADSSLSSAPSPNWFSASGKDNMASYSKLVAEACSRQADGDELSSRPAYFRGVVDCSFNIRPRRSSTLVAIVVLSGDRRVLSSGWEQPEYDLAYALEDLDQLAKIHLSGHSVMRLMPRRSSSSSSSGDASDSRAAAWNALFSFARLGGYEQVIFSAAETVASPLAVRNMLAALQGGSTPLALPADQHRSHHHRMVEAPTRFGACLFGVHFASIARFTPDLARPFDDRTSRTGQQLKRRRGQPGDALITRMLAAGVSPTMVVTTVDEVDDEARSRCGGALLSDVGAEVVKRGNPEASEATQVRIAALSTALKLNKWVATPDAAIGGCDFARGLATTNITLCKIACSRILKCAGFSFVKSVSACYFKTCTETLGRAKNIDSYEKLLNFADAEPYYYPEAAAAAVNDSYKSVAVLITVHDALEWVVHCIHSIWKNGGTSRATDVIYLINDDSSSETLLTLADLARSRAGDTKNAQGELPFPVRLVNWDNSNGNLSGYTRAINLGLRTAFDDGGFDAYCLLNSDTEVLSPNWLAALKQGAFSSDKIGVVGPLSNAASYQSAPLLREPPDGGGKVDWSKNPLPTSEWTPSAVANAVVRSSRRRLIDVPILNGFCLLVKHDVFMQVGLMDDQAFPRGFGEENDFCLRAKALGLELKVVDSVYIWHHKSKSYGDSTRLELSNRAKLFSKERWGYTLNAAVVALEANVELREMRARVERSVHAGGSSSSPLVGSASTLPSCRPSALRVMFVLNPIQGRRNYGPNRPLAMHGGWISILNEAIGLAQRGVCAHVAVSEWTVAIFESNFPVVSELGVMLPYANEVGTSSELLAALDGHAPFYDVMIATYFTTVEPIGQLAMSHPHLQPGYYIQDYEPDFVPDDNFALKKRARRSYTTIPHNMLFAKTKWLRDKIVRNHGGDVDPTIVVHPVRPSVDIAVFESARRKQQDEEEEEFLITTTTHINKKKKLHIVAMLRPSTPRRNALGTLRVLTALASQFGNLVKITTFGCDLRELSIVLNEIPPPVVTTVYDDDDAATSWTALLQRWHRGPLNRQEIARLFATADVFLDMSHWQAFGRTGLESMAAGCVPVLPLGTGCEEYAVDGFNARLVNTSTTHEAVDAISKLVHNRDFLESMRRSALDTVGKFVMEASSLSLLTLICRTLENAQRNFLMPSPCHTDLSLSFGPRILNEPLHRLTWSEALSSAS